MRIVVMRATIHLVSADDCLLLRPLMAAEGRRLLGLIAGDAETHDVRLVAVN